MSVDNLMALNPELLGKISNRQNNGKNNLKDKNCQRISALLNGIPGKRFAISSAWGYDHDWENGHAVKSSHYHQVLLRSLDDTGRRLT